MIGEEQSPVARPSVDAMRLAMVSARLEKEHEGVSNEPMVDAVLADAVATGRGQKERNAAGDAVHELFASCGDPVVMGRWHAVLMAAYERLSGAEAEKAWEWAGDLVARLDEAGGS